MFFLRCLGQQSFADVVQRFTIYIGFTTMVTRNTTILGYAYPLVVFYSADKFCVATVRTPLDNYFAAFQTGTPCSPLVYLKPEKSRLLDHICGLCPSKLSSKSAMILVGKGGTQNTITLIHSNMDPLENQTPPDPFISALTRLIESQDDISMARCERKSSKQWQNSISDYLGSSVTTSITGHGAALDHFRFPTWPSDMGG